MYQVKRNITNQIKKPIKKTNKRKKSKI